MREKVAVLFLKDYVLPIRYTFYCAHLICSHDNSTGVFQSRKHLIRRVTVGIISPDADDCIGWHVLP